MKPDKEKLCLVPGSFDPPTRGHRYLVAEALRRYGEVRVVAFINDKKTYTFSESERRRLMRAQFGDLPVRIGFSHGMLADYCRRYRVDVILKGVRNETDRRYEEEMAAYNKAHASETETVLVEAPEALAAVSSTEVRRRLADGGELAPLLGEKTLALCQRILASRTK